MQTPRAARATEIYGRQNKAIHRGCAAVGLVYNENRALWADVCSDIAGRPVESITQLSLAERNDLIMHLKRRGAKIKKPFVPSPLAAWRKGNPDREVRTGPHRPLDVPPEKRPLIGKIRALLLDMGLEWEYADGIATRMGASTAVVEWCSVDQLYNVAQALSYEQRRRRAAG